MSNVITGNPWILDTVADNIVAPGLTSKLRPKKLIWSGDAIADGDDCQLEDGNEVAVFSWHATADDTGIVFDFPPNFVMDGMSLGALGHGTLYIYF